MIAQYEEEKQRRQEQNRKKKEKLERLRQMRIERLGLDAVQVEEEVVAKRQRIEERAKRYLDKGSDSDSSDSDHDSDSELAKDEVGTAPHGHV